MWPLLGCSVVALALIVERLIQLRQQQVLPPHLLEEVMTISMANMPSTDMIDKLAEHSDLGQLLAKALEIKKNNPDCTDQELKNQVEIMGRSIAHRLENYLPTLGTIASASPLLGLLGTVVGMIEIFGAQTTGANAPAQMAYGISVALYNTAFGLLIAIPTLAVWRHLKAKVDGYVLMLELAGEQIVSHLVKTQSKN